MAFLTSARSRAVAAPEGSEENKSEGRELIYKTVNFVILAGGLAFLLRKPLRQFFAQRSDSIRKSLEEARKALESSQAQLQAVEERLKKLDAEIFAFKAHAAQEIHGERERIRRETAEEAQKILDSARALIDTATRQARLELKNYTAQQAVELAEQMIRERLDDSGRRGLVSRFVDGLKN